MEGREEEEGERSLARVIEVSASSGIPKRTAESSQTDGWTDCVAVTYMEKPRTWRLLQAKAGCAPPDEELVFTLHGIIAAKELPPISIDGRYRQR